MSRGNDSESGTASANHAVAGGSLLGEIGMIGLSDLEPIILAALATGEPMLLIGRQTWMQVRSPMSPRLQVLILTTTR